MKDDSDTAQYIMFMDQKVQYLENVGSLPIDTQIQCSPNANRQVVVEMVK